VNRTLANRRRTPGRFEAGAPKDEVSLLDLLLVMRKRRRLIVTIVLAFFTVGLALALVIPRKYAYTTLIEIGNQVAGEKMTLLESPETVQAKLTEGYIPLTLAQRYGGSSTADEQLTVKASIPRASQVVMLSSKGTLAQEEEYLKLHTAVLKHLREDHQRALSLIKKGIANQITEATNRFATLVDEEKIMQAKLERAGESEQILKTEMESLRATLDVASQNRGRAVKEVNNEVRAMTMLMLANELQQNRARLSALEERSHVQLKNERDELTKARSDNERSKVNLRSQIERLQLSLANLQETRAIVAPMRSHRPVGLGKALWVLLSCALGCFTALIAVLVAEALGRPKLNEEPSSDPIAPFPAGLGLASARRLKPKESPPEPVLQD
jgi:LPS O-antigen subunit length determinant protein (WzzB/FepE family)